MASALPGDAPSAEITNLDDLRRIAEVRAAKKPRLVSIAGGGEISLPRSARSAGR